LPSRPYGSSPGSSASPEGDSLASLDPGSGGFTNQSATSQPSEEASSLNVEELSARIRGNNVALRKLAAQLYEDRNWDVQSLTAILDQLAPLVARKDDLKLMRELVPPQQRDRVGNLESGSDLISDLGSKIARARSQVQQDESRGSVAERKHLLEQLEQLSRRLAGLVFTDQ
jgi:hypothetical protein